jgi:hypothetical protein
LNETKGGDMIEIEQAVARHYTHGSLDETILSALGATGKDVNRLTPKDLAPQLMSFMLAAGRRRPHLPSRSARGRVCGCSTAFTT